MAKTIKLLVLTVSVLMIICSCTKESSVKSLEATEKIVVYKTFSDAKQEVAFYLHPGEQCTVGKQEIGKIYSYYEVTCPNKGSGWVMLGDGYKLINNGPRRSRRDE